MEFVQNLEPLTLNYNITTSMMEVCPSTLRLLIVARPDLDWSCAIKFGLVHGRNPSSSMAFKVTCPQIWRPQLVHGREP